MNIIRQGLIIARFRASARALWQIMYTFTSTHTTIIYDVCYARTRTGALQRSIRKPAKTTCNVEVFRANTEAELRFSHYLAMLTSILHRFSVQLASQQLEKLIQWKKEPWIARQ